MVTAPQYLGTEKEEDGPWFDKPVPDTATIFYIRYYNPGCRIYILMGEKMTLVTAV